MTQKFKVPIRNIFCMLSYVNDHPELIRQLSNVDEDLITYDFLAKRFIRETERLMRRGLVKDYITSAEETSYLSGKIMMTESVPYMIEQKPVVVCEKDAYSPNILLNQIMCTTLKDLFQNPHIQENTREQCFMLWELMAEVDEIELTRECFLRVGFSRHTYHYKPMIHIARLLHELRLLSHNQGNWSLFTVELEENEMNRLFEHFLFHFYRIEQQNYRVSSERMKWNLEGNQRFLPTMLTDISLTHRTESKKIIIDAKFYKNMFQRVHHKSTFHSHNLYQIFAYVMHQTDYDDVRGILIYPANHTVQLEEKYKWSEQISLEIYSIDLNQSWTNIHERLLRVIK